ncbi:hypothetical protein V8E36_006128 [Tilletia maclaganii]
MVYFTPVKALTVSLAVVALGADTVQARPAYGGSDSPSNQLQPQARMQKVVLRSNPPPPLPAGIETTSANVNSSSNNARRSFAEQGNYKRSKSKAAAANNRRVFRRAEGGSKRSPSSQVHEHLHIHDHDRGYGHGRGRHVHGWSPVVIDDRVRHHSLHWAEHHGLVPLLGKKGQRPTWVQLGKKGVTIVNRVVSGVPGVSKIISSFPAKGVIVPKAVAPAVKGPSKAAPKTGPKVKAAAKPNAAPKPKAATKPAASKPVGKGKRRHIDRYDNEYYRCSGRDHDHEHVHNHYDDNEHVHSHGHFRKRDEVARISVGDDGQFYRSANEHQVDLLSLKLRSIPEVGVMESFDDSGAEVETSTSDGSDGSLSKRRHNDKYYYYNDGYYWDDYPSYYYGMGSRHGGNAHIHEHIHSHGGSDYGHGWRHYKHGYGGGDGNVHVHEHVHAHKRGVPADTAPLTAEVGGLKADTPLGSLDANDIQGSAGKLASGSKPKLDVHHVKAGAKKGKDKLKAHKHKLNAAKSGLKTTRPDDAHQPNGASTAAAFIDADHLTHTLAQRGLLGGLLKPLLAPLNAIPGFIQISDLLFGDDNVIKKVAALVLHAEPAPSSGVPGAKMMATTPPFKYSLMSSVDERTQVYLVPADLSSAQPGSPAQQTFAAAMNNAAGSIPSSDAPASTDPIVVKIVVPLLNTTTGAPSTLCATFAAKPPSPLELLPCTGGLMANANATGAGAPSFAVVSELPGKSQRFQYTSSTGMLSPLYEQEVAGVLKQMLSADQQQQQQQQQKLANAFHSGTRFSSSGFGDEDGNNNNEEDENAASSSSAEDADDVDFFGMPVDNGSSNEGQSAGGNFARNLDRQLAVDTTGSSEGDADDFSFNSNPSETDDPISDLNDPAAAGVSGFDDSSLADSDNEDEGMDGSSSMRTVSPMKTNAMAPSGVDVQLKFVPAGAWPKQMSAGAAAATSAAATSAASTSAPVAATTSAAADSSSAGPSSTAPSSSTTAATTTASPSSETAAASTTAAPAVGSAIAAAAVATSAPAAADTSAPAAAESVATSDSAPAAADSAAASTSAPAATSSAVADSTTAVASTTSAAAADTTSAAAADSSAPAATSAAPAATRRR